MIPDFKTYINESVWGDIRKRGLGTEVKAEDDINILSQDELFEYINDHYKVRIFELENRHKSFYKDNEIDVPYARPRELSYGLCVSLEFKRKEKIVTFSHCLEKDIPEVYEKICKNYRVEPKTRLIDKAYPLDGSEVTNKFFIDLIEFLIDNVPESNRLVSRKNITESVWNDIRKQGLGDEVKKEDNVDLLDREKFFEYLDEHYVPTYSIINFRLYKDLNIVLAPMFSKDRGTLPRQTVSLSIEYGDDPSKTEITIGGFMIKKFPDVEKIIRDNFCVVDMPTSENRGEYIKIYPKETGENTIVGNSFFLKVYDFILNQDYIRDKYIILMNKK